MNKEMPVLGYFADGVSPYTIPFEMLKPHASRARENHGGQSLEVLLQRGGLGEYEAIAILKDLPLAPWPFKGWSQDKAREILTQMIKEYEQRRHN